MSLGMVPLCGRSTAMSGNPELLRKVTVCNQCKKELIKEEVEKHFHLVNKVSEEGEPLVYMLLLPPDCKPEEWKARRIFAGGMAELREMHPDKEFQISPYSFKVVTEQAPDGRSTTFQLFHPESFVAIEK